MNSLPNIKTKKQTFLNLKIFRILAITYVLGVGIIIFLNDFKETQHLFFIFATVQYLDKVGHLVIMGFLSFVVNLALNARQIRISKIQYLLGSIIVFTVVTIEEVSQLFVSGRNFEFSDMFFNTVGVILFGELARLTVKFTDKYRQNLEENFESVK